MFNASSQIINAVCVIIGEFVLDTLLYSGL